MADPEDELTRLIQSVAKQRDAMLSRLRTNVAFLNATVGCIPYNEEADPWPFADCMPPLEKIVPSSESAARRIIRSKIRRGDLLHGIVSAVAADELRISAESAAEPTEDGDAVFDIDLREAPLRVACPSGACGAVPCAEFLVGSRVTAVVTGTDEEHAAVTVSLDPWALTGRPRPPLAGVPSEAASAGLAAAAAALRVSGAFLGAWPPDDATCPLWSTLRRAGARPTLPPAPPLRPAMTPADLAEDSGFLNPGSVSAMLRAYGVGGVLSAAWEVAHAPEAGHLALRRRQNRLWATNRVARGVEHARAGRHKDALRAYDRAAELDPEFADAFVARGALLSTMGKFVAALGQFETALRIDPAHENALRYLDKTEARMGVPEGQRRAEYLRRKARGEDEEGTREGEAGGGAAGERPGANAAAEAGGTVSLHGDARTGGLRLRYGEGVGIVPPARVPAAAARTPASGTPAAPPGGRAAAAAAAAAAGDATGSVQSLSRAELLRLIRSRAAAEGTDPRRGTLGAGPPSAGASLGELNTLVMASPQRASAPAAAATPASAERGARKRGKHERKKHKSKKKKAKGRKRGSSRRRRRGEDRSESESDTSSRSGESSRKRRK